MTAHVHGYDIICTFDQEVNDVCMCVRERERAVASLVSPPPLGTSLISTKTQCY